MAVDKDLFLYDFAVVAIIKDESPYVKEWLDYHILAGVNHFYIYDNDSSDNLREVLQPYIDNGTVTYTAYPGEARQNEAYIEAFKAYRFFCRYMAFISTGEFIFPQNKKGISEVIDKNFKYNPNIGGLEINWMNYSSNNSIATTDGQMVLETFTRRALNYDKDTVKTISNPRKINYLFSPHYIVYFNGISKDSADAKKILINQYRLKQNRESDPNRLEKREELSQRLNVLNFIKKIDDSFFDDSILKYRDARQKLNIQVKQIDYEKLINALFKVIAPMLNEELPVKFFEGKMEMFLTCRALASYLKENILDKERGEFIEKATLNAIYSTMQTDMSLADTEMLLSELPNILPLNYPVVDNIRAACVEIISQLKDAIRMKIDNDEKLILWHNFNEYDNLLRLLKGFEGYNK